jgi:tetratricopeptide (TPR) repeat protein
MPDEIPSTADMCDRGLFGGFSSIFFRNRRSGNPGQRTTYIGNDLGNLTGVLRQNLFSCILAHESDDDEPIRSGLDELKRRMSVIRLNHQATRKGLIVDQDIKWQLRAAQWHSPLPPTTADYKLHSLVKYGDPVDLIPESPCDWIPYDPEMTGNNIDCGLNFNLDDYEEFYWQYYSRPNAIGATETEDADSEAKSSATESLHGNKRKLDSEQTGEPIIVANGSAESKVTIQPCTADVAATTVTVTPDKSGTGSLVSKSSLSSDEEDSADAIIAAAEAAIEAAGTSKAAQTFHSLKVLHDTVSMLKEAGNQAQKAGLPGLAARRYDQAIQYCSVVFLEFPRGNLDIFAARNTAIAVSDGASNVGRIEWSPLLKLLIETRLNLSVVLLKLECDPEPKKAADLAMTALFELGPFVVERGHIRKGHKYSEIHSSKEPHSTYRVAKELQAKAYFRLGSAQQEMRNHEDAVKSFEHSIKSTKAIGKKPETVVLRRLAEAKRLKARKNKSQRKKLKAMFGGGGDEEKTADAKFGVASATTDEKTTEEEGKDDE